MRPRQEQDPLVVRNTPPQDRLDYVVDHTLVSFRDRPDVQLPDQAALAEVHVLVVTKVLLDGESEPNSLAGPATGHGSEGRHCKRRGERMWDPAYRPAGRQSR